MASIKILEKDYTKSEVYSATDTIVYIPGMIGLDVEGNPVSAGSLLGIPQLFTNLSDFEEKVGVSPMVIEQTSERVNYDKSYVIAKQLIGSGMKVLYEMLGKDGSPVIDEETFREVVSQYSHWEKLEDRALYNVRFLTTGGYYSVSESDSSIANTMTQLAFTRGDCVALVDHPIDMVEASALKKLFNTMNISNAEYATAFTPWCKFDLSVEFNGIEVDDPDGYWSLPGSFSYLMAFNNMAQSYENWLAAAGASRGAIPLLVSPLVEFGDKVCNSLQSREEGFISINPITYVTPYGYRVYGNRTLKQNIDGLKATSFLNIRNLVSDIKKTCFQACRIMAFEQNTDILWFNLKSKITPILEKMVSNEGIRAYQLVRISTNEKAKVVGKIRIVPIEAVEDFEITIELVDSLDVETL